MTDIVMSARLSPRHCGELATKLQSNFALMRRGNPSLRLRHDGLLRFARNDGVWHLRKNPRSRGMICPSFASRFALSRNRGRRESRVHAAPAVSRAIGRSRRTRAYRFSGGTPAFPARWLYGLYVLSPARPGSFVTVVRKALSHPAKSTPTTGASGPHDFTVRFTCVRLSHDRRPPHPTARS